MAAIAFPALIERMIKITKELLDRYHRGECTNEEELAVQSWLDNPETEVYLPDPDRLKQMEKQIWERITPEPSLNRRKAQRGRSRNIWGLVGIAAMLLLVCAISLWRQKPLPVSVQVVSAAYGKKVEARLPDGTQVYLNSGSTLRYPKHFDGDSRKVILEGEAYFDVHPDAERPFYVEGGKARIKVLGTRFNLKAYRDEEVVSVAVEQGMILFSVIGGKDSVILKAKQQALLQQHGLATSQLSTATVALWKDHVLAFDNMTLKEAIPILERWYNIQINLQDARLGEQRWSGTFQNPSLHKLLHFLQFTLNISYTLHNHTLTLFEE